MFMSNITIVDQLYRNCPVCACLRHILLTGDCSSYKYTAVSVHVIFLKKIRKNNSLPKRRRTFVITFEAIVVL